MQTGPPVEPRRRASWFTQPVVWLGIAVFAASIAGSIWLIVASARYDDESARLPTGRQIFGVPSQPASPAPAR